MKTAVLISGLLVLLVANVLMVYYAPYGFSRQGFQSGPNMASGMEGFQSGPPIEGFQKPGHMTPPPTEGKPGVQAATPMAKKGAKEGFQSYYLENAGGAKEVYSPIGAFDGVKLSTGNSVSGWRYTAPNEHLMGPEFSPDADNLFMFKNNQCKPECCGASFSCGGGCVCTTPQQRQYIAGRGGNRTGPEDSA
jgi:hypothetical protein